jgi:hypothetical protein
MTGQCIGIKGHARHQMRLEADIKRDHGEFVVAIKGTVLDEMHPAIQPEMIGEDRQADTNPEPALAIGIAFIPITGKAIDVEGHRR